MYCHMICIELDLRHKTNFCISFRFLKMVLFPQFPFLCLSQHLYYLQVISENNQQFSKDLARRMRNLSQAEVEELLRNYLAGVEALRGMRNADRDRLNAKLQERLAMGTRTNMDVSTREPI